MRFLGHLHGVKMPPALIPVALPQLLDPGKPCRMSIGASIHLNNIPAVEGIQAGRVYSAL